MEFINTTTTYTHKEKGGSYRIVAIHKSKHPDTGEWYPCVTYQNRIDERLWTRSLNSFLENFEDYHERKAKRIEEASSTTSPVGK